MQIGIGVDEDELIALRRDLHAHPELGYHETRTTELIVGRLRALGLEPRVLPGGTGVLCDLGARGPLVALRADIDALPLPDEKDVPYRSTVDGLCHACGHDAHTTILLGAAAALARIDLPGRLRLIFQPAEEQVPGGAHSVMVAGGLDDGADGVAQIYALHCDPQLPAGQIGLRPGAITAACDTVAVHLSGPGGHTARPQLTAELVYALGRLITDLPGLLTRRVDPRSVLSLVWGAVQAGEAPNAIPTAGVLRGTLRTFDRDAWDSAEQLLRQLVDEVVAPTGARAQTEYVRGVPPVVNDPSCVQVQRTAAVAALGAEAVTGTPQSMGGEDFAWYLDRAPGALARLGVARPGATGRLDLHRSSFDIDESALLVGVQYTVELARAALASAAPVSAAS